MLLDPCGFGNETANIEKEGFMAADSLQKQQKKGRGRPFRKGQSGNPAGRVVGSRNKATLIAEAMLEDESGEVTRTVIDRAKAGDAMGMRLCFERMVAPRRERPVQIDLPPVGGIGDAGAAIGAIVAAAGAGVITPADAGELSRVVDVLVRAVEASDFDRRLRELEAALARRS
jgi:hypothetical protein